MDKASTVSVIIPCYNAAAFLRETLDSVIAQTAPPLEVLLIDDGSTDDSAAIARSYGSPVRVIQQPNQGESVARNRGLNEARGHWVAFLDADDVWVPTKLERQLALTADRSAIAVHSELYYFGDHTGTTSIQKIPADERYSLERVAKENIFVAPSALLVRRDVSPEFSVKYRYGEDWIYFLELIGRGKIELVPEPLTGYRRHRASQSSSAYVHLHWYATISSWMDESDRVSPELRGSVDRFWATKLCGAARRLKRQRQWEKYWEVRKFLHRFEQDPAIQRVTRQVILPRPVYWLKDALTKCGITMRIGKSTSC